MPLVCCQSPWGRLETAWRKGLRQNLGRRLRWQFSCDLPLRRKRLGSRGSVILVDTTIRVWGEAASTSGLPKSASIMGLWSPPLVFAQIPPLIVRVGSDTSRRVVGNSGITLCRSSAADSFRIARDPGTICSHRFHCLRPWSGARASLT